MEYKWRVKKSERGISLENFIYKQLSEWSHSQVKKAIDKKRAFINGKNVFVSKWNLKPNDLVVFSPGSGDLPSFTKERYRFVEVLFEDSYLIAVSKPPFIDFEEFTSVVQDYLRRRNKIKSYPYLGQMHRLDKETSGVMIFTKKKIANTLADQFRDHTIQKCYLALVDGLVEDESATIRKTLEKGEFDDGKKVRIAPKQSEGMTAVTSYQLMERHRATSLLRVEILTGRTHQIRVHLSDLGYPVVGDKIYGKQDGVGFKRQVLHAERLLLRHPVTRQKLKILAPIPEDIQQLIDHLRESV
ncbi:MAG: RluA family pseudouridine synthase [bacterium]|nr:RluA family pseudouridine synthase [bacterium]MBU1918922.1 RluA family pseudouridine synthase [bacterium]